MSDYHVIKYVSFRDHWTKRNALLLRNSFSDTAFPFWVSSVLQVLQFFNEWRPHLLNRQAAEGGEGLVHVGPDVEIVVGGLGHGAVQRHLPAALALGDGQRGLGVGDLEQ